MIKHGHERYCKIASCRHVSASERRLLPARQVKQDEPAVESVTPERAELEQAVKDLQAHVNTAQRNLEFSIDDSTHAVVVKVIATDSGEIIRQLPTEAALKLAQSLADGRSGLLDATI